MRRTRRKAAPIVNPWSDRTDRAPCFRVSPYQDLMWRETYEDLTRQEKERLSHVTIPGFARTFGAELVHRLSADPVREIPTGERSKHARARAMLHASIAIPSDVRAACFCKPLYAAKVAARMLASIAGAIGRIGPVSDPERAKAEKKAAKDLGLDPSAKPKAERKPKEPAKPKGPKGEPGEGLEGDGAGSGEPGEGEGEGEGSGEGSGEGEPGEGEGTGEPGALSADDLDEIDAATAQADADALDELDGLGKEIERLSAQAAQSEVGKQETSDKLEDAWKKGGSSGSGSDDAGGGSAPDLTLTGIAASHPELKKVLAIAGRLVPVLDRLADDKKAKQGIGRSRIECTTQIARLTSRDLAGIAGMRGGIVAAETYRRVLEGSALGYQGEDPAGEGPIVVVVDQSGSMFDPYDGCDAQGNYLPNTKQEWAMAVALAILVRASRSGRKVAIVPYDTQVKPQYVRAWTGRPSLASAAKAVGISRYAHGGGTRWGAGIGAALDLIEHSIGNRMRKADIVHVTDGHSGDSYDHGPYRERAKRLHVRIHGIAVGSAAEGIAGSPESPLAQWSDTICAVTDSTCDSVAVQALGRI